MEFTDLIRSRQSIRNYDPERPLAKETIMNILEAGRLAPSACNNQPWKFIVVSSPAMLEKVRPCYTREWYKEAPHILVMVGIKDKAWVRGSDGYNSVETDAAIAMTHIILAAENAGVGTCWIGNYDPVSLKAALNLGDNHIVFGITPLGYPKAGFKKSSAKVRKPLEEIVDFI